GQRRLLAPGSALRRAVEAGRVHSMILWGPPGCGKTTLALLLAKYADAEFRAISAVLSGLPDVRVVLAEAAERFANGRRPARVHSMILWGPPGCGKTTLALLLAKYADAEFRAISAVLSGLPDVRVVLAEAAERFANGRRTVLFVDEVHRFNKAQQDAFLPHIERGTILFVGATTENPSFELNSALLSRCRVHVMEAVSVDDIAEALRSEEHT